jgi:hypothetical protein
MTLKKVCAWCQADLGELECPQSGITHGICQSCCAKAESQYWLQPRHLAAGLILETDDDLTLKLKYQGQTIASFSSPINRRSIHQAADQYLLVKNQPFELARKDLGHRERR